MAELPLILWIGDGAPSEGPPSARLLRRTWREKDYPEADLVILAADNGRVPPLEFLGRFNEDLAPAALFAVGLDEDAMRTMLNHGPIFRILSEPSEIADTLEIAVAFRRERRGRNEVLRDASRRHKDLETMTQKLERAVAERTGVLEESAREERDKLARERQLIRFLNDLSVQTSTEDILRVLRRELRRFHRIQSLVVAVGEDTGAHDGFHGTQFYCSQGDKVLRVEGDEDLELVARHEKSLRQTLANRFGRPFNKLLVIPLEIHAPAHAILGVESSMLGEDELREITELLQDRGRSVAMAVERLSMEDRQRRFAVRWERTFDGFRDPIAVVDDSLTVLRGNRAFASAPQRKKCHESFAGRDTPCEGCPLGEDPTVDRTLEGTVRVGRRAYRLRSWPVKEPGASRISGRVNHYDDITESRELSLRMLQNEKMSAIGELAGHIAHELNNPLTGIRSLAQVLRTEWTEKPLAEDLAHIEQAAKRCQMIIRHLLEFTKGGNGEAAPVRIDEVVEMTLPLLKTALRRHRQEVVLAGGRAKVLADAHLLQQVVFNLVNNACQAMKEPGRVGIATRVVDEGGSRFVELRVIDDGPGISPEIRDRLFEPFLTTKKEGEGTGLGLSTSKAIIERFGGRISFRSESDRGTEFTVRFPLQKDGE